VRTILITLASAAVLAATAQPALADDPGAVPWTHFGTNNEVRTCALPEPRTGVEGQFGALGYFVDGCTTKAYCPSYARWCRVTSTGNHAVSNTNGTYVTLNSRLRRFNSNGTVRGWQDGNCGSWNSCGVELRGAVLGGQAASTQCNGVRRKYAIANKSMIRCTIFLEYQYTTPPAGI
jgi:hypothetical protein